VRECREELGLEVVARETLCVVEWSYPGRRARVHFVRCEARGEPEPVALDGQALAWADAAELSRLRMLPANAEVLALLSAHLAPGG
jgi:8-oxo-dGTP pyrophosphatase MutT (NUDIX family)